MKYTQDQWEHYVKMDDALDTFAEEFVFEETGVATVLTMHGLTQEVTRL